MKLTKLAAVAGGLITGIALMLAVLQLSAADQPSPTVDEPNPCAGQTDEQCNQTVDTLRSEGNAKVVKWVKDFIASGQDPRSLPRSPTTALPAPAASSLDLAVEGAETIVIGYITDVDFEVVLDDTAGPASVWGTAHVSVEGTLKGDQAKEIMVVQSGGPQPNSDLKSGSLAYSEATPYLLKGDRALLFLKKDELGYYVQGWTGTYLVDKEDKLDAVAGNPFGASVEAQSLSQFSAEIEAVVAGQAAAR